MPGFEMPQIDGAPMADLGFTEGQKRAIGSRLSTAVEAIRRLRGVGFEVDALSALESAIGEMATKTGAHLRQDGPSVVQASVAQLLITAAELRPGALSRYGDLDETSARYLEAQSERFTALADSLLEPVTEKETRASIELTAQSRADADAKTRPPTPPSDPYGEPVVGRPVPPRRRAIVGACLWSSMCQVASRSTSIISCSTSTARLPSAASWSLEWSGGSTAYVTSSR
jgi:hypothetical protein